MCDTGRMNESDFTLCEIYSLIRPITCETWLIHKCPVNHIQISHVTPMDKSCHTYGWDMSHLWMSHGTRNDCVEQNRQQKGGTSQVTPTKGSITKMNESRNTFKATKLRSKTTSTKRGVTHTHEWYHRNEWVMSHVWTSHVAHTNASCHTYEWVMSQGARIQMSRITWMNESCRMRERVMSHGWTSHVAHTNASCHTYEWVMSNTWMSHGTHTQQTPHQRKGGSRVRMSRITHTNEACRTYERVVSQTRMHHVTQNK